MHTLRPSTCGRTTWVSSVVQWVSAVMHTLRPSTCEHKTRVTSMVQWVSAVRTHLSSTCEHTWVSSVTHGAMGVCCRPHTPLSPVNTRHGCHPRCSGCLLPSAHTSRPPVNTRHGCHLWCNGCLPSCIHSAHLPVHGQHKTVGGCLQHFHTSSSWRNFRE